MRRSQTVLLTMLGLVAVVVAVALYEEGASAPDRVWLRGPGWHRVALRAGTYQAYDQLYDDDSEPPDDLFVVPAKPQLIGPERRPEMQLGAQVEAGRESWVAWLEPEWVAPSGYAPQVVLRVRASGYYRVQDLTVFPGEQMFLGPPDATYRHRTLLVIAGAADVLCLLFALVAFRCRARPDRVLESEPHE